MRIEDENVERGAVAAGGHRRRPGIARGRTDDRHVLAAPGQHRVEHQPDELQRQVLERQRRAVKQLEQPDPLVELYQRRHRRMRERAIGPLRKTPEFVGSETPGREQRDDARRDLRIRPPRQIAQRLAVERREPFGNVEAAVLGEAGEQYLFERAGDRRRPGIAGAQIAHDQERSLAPPPSQPDGSGRSRASMRFSRANPRRIDDAVTAIIDLPFLRGHSRTRFSLRFLCEGMVEFSERLIENCPKFRRRRAAE